MGTFVSILLIVLAIIVVIGIIRVIIKPSESFGEMIIDILFLDVLCDVLSSIIEHIDFD